MAAVRHVKATLRAAIITPLDRNAGQLFVACPLLFYDNFCKTFGLDVVHFEGTGSNTVSPKIMCSEMATVMRDEASTVSPAEVAATCTQKSHSTAPNPSITKDKAEQGILRTNPPSTYKLLPQLEPAAVLRHWKTTFSHLVHLGKLVAGSLPYAYIVPKDKDTSRYRPIISYVQAPHRQLLRTTARGLLFILQQLDCKHFSLWSAYKAKDAVLSAHKQLSLSVFAQEYAHWRVQCLSVDIKEMYTELPHPEIRQAVTWATTRFHRQYRRDRVNVNRRGKAEGRAGRVYDNHLRREIILTDIVNVTELALQEAYFAAADLILLQRNGIPMGCPTSPAFAIAVCIYSEHLFLDSMTNVPRPLVGVRYFDDLLLWTLVRTSPSGMSLPGEDVAATNMLNLHKNIYHPSLRLIDQQGGPRSFNFLETIVSFGTQQGITTTYLNKNRDTLLLQTPTQKIQRFRHGASAAPHGSLRSVVQSMFSRATVFETNPLQWVATILLLSHEFCLLDYPVASIVQTLHRLSRRHHLGPAWSFIASLL